MDSRFLGNDGTSVEVEGITKYLVLTDKSYPMYAETELSGEYVEFLKSRLQIFRLPNQIRHVELIRISEDRDTTEMIQGAGYVP